MRVPQCTGALEPLERRREHSTFERAGAGTRGRAPTATRGLPRPRSTRSGTVAGRRLVRAAARPPPPRRSRGRIRSSTIAAGRRRAADSTASTPSAASCTAKPRSSADAPHLAPRARVGRGHHHHRAPGLGERAEERQGEAERRALAGRALRPRSGRRGPGRSARRWTGRGRSPRCRSLLRSCSRENGRKSRPRSSRAIPMPRSLTLTIAVSRSRRTARRTSPPAGEYLTAFESRLSSTSAIRSSSAQHGSGSSGSSSTSGWAGSDGKCGGRLAQARREVHEPEVERELARSRGASSRASGPSASPSGRRRR